MNFRHFLVGVALWLGWVGLSQAQGELSTSPNQPPADKPFTVALVADLVQRPDPPPTYTWKVKVTDQAGRKIDLADAGLIGELPTAPAITIGRRHADLQYEFELVKVVAGFDPVSLTFAVPIQSAGAELALVAGQPVEGQPPAGGAPADPAVGGQPAADPAAGGAAVPVPAPAPNVIVSGTQTERLRAARQWAERVAQAPKSGELVLPVEYFKKGLSTILRINDRLLLDAEALYDAMHSAALRHPPGADPALVIQAWTEAEDKFLKAIVEDSQTEEMAADWKKFLDAWQQAAVAKDTARFHEALIQAGLIITGLAIDADDASIRSALTTGGPLAGSAAAASGGAAGGSYGTSHAAVHHARVMQRIYLRNDRRTARIGRYGY